MRACADAKLRGKTYRFVTTHPDTVGPVQAAQTSELLSGPLDTNLPVILAGDFNITPAESTTFEELASWGFSAPGPRIDHVLVRGGSPAPLLVWPPERRRFDGRLLSDHAPVEVTIE